MRRGIVTPRRTAAAVALAAATALGGAGAMGAARSAAATPRCTGSGLVAWLDTQGDGAAGSIYYRLRLTNLSGHACHLAGYPGVSAVGLTGRQVGRAASRDRTFRPRAVVLANGATASAVLRIVEALNFPSASCHPVTAAGLRVYPPGDTAAKAVPFPFEACARRGPVFLTVRPVASR